MIIKQRHVGNRVIRELEGELRNENKVLSVKPSDMRTTKRALKRFVEWARRDALPFWEKHGLDKNGGGYETLLLDTSPDIDALRRVRVQARQAYVFAHAGHLDWSENAKPVSDHFWEYLISKGMQGGIPKLSCGFGGCAHLLGPDGTLHDGLRDTYAQAFVILAGAWRCKAFQDEQALDIAVKTVAFLDEFCTASSGGWVEGVPANLPRRQNPHMHLFEAFMALYDASGDILYLNKANDIYVLFTTHFFNQKDASIIEFFDADWQPVGGQGGPIEPGHMMEWCWLLCQFERISGENTSVYADALYKAAIKLGQNPRTGLLYDEVNMLTKTSSKSSRNWAQTEFLKASIAQARAGDLQAFLQIPNLIDNIFSYYLDPAPKGGWIDQIDLSGQAISKDMPASTFYHWMCAAAEAHAFLQSLDD